MALLEIENLHLGLRTAAGVVHALRGVTLRVDEGDVLAVVGESGCGKTVTMQTVLGLFASREIAYQQGRVAFAGRELLGLSEEEMRRLRGSEIAMVFQDPTTALNPTLTIGRQISEAILAHRHVIRGQAMREAVALLAQVGVPQPEMRAAQYPFQLSGGLRQRAVIASALACGPKLLIADEPTTALDVTIQAQILALLRSLQRQYRMAIILVTHDLGVVAEMAHRVAVMYAGRIVEEGPIDAIFTRPSHPYTWGLLECLPRLSTARNQKLRTIEGAPPDLVGPLPGCAFAYRCPHAMAVCEDHAPPMFDAGMTHHSACWLLHPHAAPIAKGTRLGKLSDSTRKEEFHRGRA